MYVRIYVIRMMYRSISSIFADSDCVPVEVDFANGLFRLGEVRFESNFQS